MKKICIAAIALFASAACGGEEEVPDNPNPVEQANVKEPFRLTPEFWNTCAGTRDYQATTLQCGDVTVVHTPMQMGGADKKLMRKVAMDATTKFIRSYPGITASNFRPPMDALRGRTAIVYDLEVEASDGSGKFPAKGTTVIRSEGPQEATGMMCFDRGEQDLSRCQPIVEWMLVRGVPEDVALTDVSEPVAFAGEELAVPSGCKTESGDDIVCEDGIRLQWTEEDAANPGSHERFVAVAVESLQKAVKKAPTKREDVPCRIAGVKTTCEHLVFEAPDGPVFLLKATPTVRDQNTGVVCVWAEKSSPAGVVPPGCETLISAW